MVYPMLSSLLTSLVTQGWDRRQTQDLTNTHLNPYGWQSYDKMIKHTQLYIHTKKAHASFLIIIGLFLVLNDDRNITATPFYKDPLLYIRLCQRIQRQFCLHWKLNIMNMEDGNRAVGRSWSCQGVAFEGDRGKRDISVAPRERPKNEQS